MFIDFSKLTSSTNKILLEPRDIFMSLPNKNNNYSYPRDVQSEVWEQWFYKRDEKDVIIKMNTGSGKTVVGLTILQSCLNEGRGPAVYVAPDNYLVQQVCSEAEKLGISAVSDIENGNNLFKFKEGKAIFVTNISKLVNGKSIFGMRRNRDENIEIGSIVIDDVHACLDIIEQQYTMLIRREHSLYEQLVLQFKNYKEVNDSQSFSDIYSDVGRCGNYLVPFWVWQQECKNIYKMINDGEHSNDDFVKFNMPLLRDNWDTANCVISPRGIEITLKGIPIDKILSFEQAQRRIFMSATLTDDSVFVSAIGLKFTEDFKIITPNKADDIGERLILYPQYLNRDISDDDVKQKLVNFSKKFNVVVIVPSFNRADFWKDTESYQILSSRDGNLESGLARLKEEEYKGLTILVNKYDGIDLPNDDCRILVIDGLPAMNREYDMAIHGMNCKDRRILRKQIQKIEQGMGRGVRSNADYCVVVFMGDELINPITHNEEKDTFFSSSTNKQLKLSRQIWDQIVEGKEETPNINDIFSPAQYVFDRDRSWITSSKNALTDVMYSKTSNVDSFVVAMRDAFEKECLGRYDEAFSILEIEKNKTNEPRTQGLLMQYMAEYKNFINPSEAQTLLHVARKLNPMVLNPIDGTNIFKQQPSLSEQVDSIINYMGTNKLNGNNYILHVQTILKDLAFSSDSAYKFEEALKKIGSIIGFTSSRPEKEYGSSAPDNLLALSNSEYAIIECKNLATNDGISKDDCNQLHGSIQWFKNHYKNTYLKFYPIMIHNSSKFRSEASPGEDFRIMTSVDLDKFCDSIKKFATAIVEKNCGTGNTNEVEKLLKDLKLGGNKIIQAYTRSFSKKI